MKSSDADKLLAIKLLELVDNILLHLNSDFGKKEDSYPDLIKARNILTSGDIKAMKAIREKFRSGFRMIDESVKVDNELNKKINKAYEIVVTNTFFN